MKSGGHYITGKGYLDMELLEEMEEVNEIGENPKEVTTLHATV